MIRTQIQFTEEQMQTLKALSQEQDCSVSELVRRAVNSWVAAQGFQPQQELRARAAAVAGRFRSGLGDLAERHDHYLAEPE